MNLIYDSGDGRAHRKTCLFALCDRLIPSGYKYKMRVRGYAYYPFRRMKLKEKKLQARTRTHTTVMNIVRVRARDGLYNFRPRS